MSTYHYLGHSSDPKFAKLISADKQAADARKKAAEDEVPPALKAHVEKVQREYAASKKGSK